MTMPTDGIKISQLTSITSSQPSDVYPMVQSGTTKKADPGLLLADYKSLAVLPSVITYLGNRSYQITIPATDVTGAISAGFRIRTTRATAAPTQNASLNGTTQFFNNTSPNKMTFTDDFVVSAWVKLTSYTTGVIASRYNGASGWDLRVESSGQISLYGFNAGGGNYRAIQSYQSVPLNKWVHIAAQLDMSTFTSTTTTSYVMIDGLDVPASSIQAGTNPTALIQAGNLEIGSRNSGTAFFPGKIAQVAVFNAKVTQATMRGYISQGLLGTETTLSSAWSLSNSLLDLNTTTPNNLTAQGAAATTNADAPFGTQASGLISSTIDYGIVQSISFSSDTTIIVQVPEGCTLPTGTNPTSALSYSSAKAPYGFPSGTSKWEVASYQKSRADAGSTTTGVLRNPGSWSLTVPIGKWKIWYEGSQYINRSTGGMADFRTVISTTAASLTGAIDLLGSNQYVYGSPDGGYWVHREAKYEALTATTLYVNMYPSGITVASIGWLHDYSPGVFMVENAYL